MERLLVLRWHRVDKAAYRHQLIARGDKSLLFRPRGVSPLRQEALLGVVPCLLLLLLLLLGGKPCREMLLPRLLLMMGILLLLLPRPLRSCATTQLGLRPMALAHTRTVIHILSRSL